MKTGVRSILLLVDAFIALTAIGGGIALVVGLEANRFPLAMLAGTPFTSYVIPGLLLAVIVGGSAAVAAVMVWRRTPRAPQASILAGLIMMGWIVGEILLLEQAPEPTGTEIVYFVLGLMMVALGLLIARETQKVT